jgi:hypothetical protein
MDIGNKAANIDEFMKACTEIRAEVENKKSDYRADKKKLAITDPEE